MRNGKPIVALCSIGGNDTTGGISKIIGGDGDCIGNVTQPDASWRKD